MAFYPIDQDSNPRELLCRWIERNLLRSREALWPFHGQCSKLWNSSCESWHLCRVPAEIRLNNCNISAADENLTQAFYFQREVVWPLSYFAVDLIFFWMFISSYTNTTFFHAAPPPFLFLFFEGIRSSDTTTMLQY